jgi:hypothetical protein
MVAVPATLDDQLLDELARVFMHAAIERVIAGDERMGETAEPTADSAGERSMKKTAKTNKDDLHQRERS